MSDPSTHPLPIGEIVQGPSAFEQFLENNQKLIAVSAVAIALGIGGFMVYRTIQKDHAADAGAALSAAKDIAELEKVKVDFSDTPSAVTAAMGIADKLWSNGQQDEAIATLREIIEKFPSHPASVAAQNSLGYRLLAQGKTGDASQAFQAVIDRADGRYLAPAATIALGDIAKKAGELDKAASLYKKVSSEFGDSPFARVASDRTKFLHFAAPVEVEAPPVVSEPPPSLIKPDDATSTGGSTGNPLLDSLNQPGTTPTPDTPKPEESTPPSTPPAPVTPPQ
jgi:predicted negative regulator of RcsB-dependent stress response